MIATKTPAQIAELAEAGAILAIILETLKGAAVPGVSTLDLDDLAQELAATHAVEPILLGYHPSFAPTPYPAATCISLNNCVQHGIPRADIVLAAGDAVNIDMSIAHDGMVVDAGLTVGIGMIDADTKRLIETTREALAAGIKAAVPGGRIGDISAAIQRHVESRGLSVVRELCGHGVGYEIHEEPNIPNYGKAGTGPLIEVGHVYAIEPIVNIGGADVVFDDDGDGYGVYTEDDSWSAHFEHTVAITKDGPKILTKR
jgi:methionyl aminopeptidase